MELTTSMAGLKNGHICKKSHLKMVNPRDIAGNAEEENEVSHSLCKGMPFPRSQKSLLINIIMKRKCSSDPYSLNLLDFFVVISPTQPTITKD